MLRLYSFFSIFIFMMILDHFRIAWNRNRFLCELLYFWNIPIYIAMLWTFYDFGFFSDHPNWLHINIPMFDGFVFQIRRAYFLLRFLRHAYSCIDVRRDPFLTQCDKVCTRLAWVICWFWFLWMCRFYFDMDVDLRQYIKQFLRSTFVFSTTLTCSISRIYTFAFLIHASFILCAWFLFAGLRQHRKGMKMLLALASCSIAKMKQPNKQK